MLQCGLVERLGAVTTLCMLDEDTVCQPTSAIKEVFLVDSKVGNLCFVLNLFVFVPFSLFFLFMPLMVSCFGALPRHIMHTNGCRRK